MFKMSKDKAQIERVAVILGLIFIAYLAYFVRAGTLSSPTVLDYDPWWFFRHTQEIVNNNFQPLKWDTLSYYPPGRPNDVRQGWPYTMAVFYKLSGLFGNYSLTDVVKFAPILMVILAIIPAFLLGRLIKNKWAGLLVALFAVLTPTLIGVSMGGYADSDAPVNFLFFTTIYLIIRTLKKPTVPNYAFSIIANLFFAFSWNGGWFPLILFTLFIPGFLIFRFIENTAHSRKMPSFAELKPEFKNIVKPLVIILAVSSVLGEVFGLSNPLASMLVSLGFVFGEGLIVNVSVAELQPVNILTKEGFLSIAGRVGIGPMLFSLLGVPAIILYKLKKKIKTNFVEVFLLSWWIISYILILRGVRFSLLFSIATAVAAGYVMANLIAFMRKRQQIAYQVFLYGVIVLISLFFVSDAILTGYQNSGLQISQNWYSALDWLKTNADKDSLVTTWWDPGHIITGYTGLKVQADGAHCSPADCIPYNHNIRIKDAGKMFVTSSETEALDILKKYKELTPAQCSRVRAAFGDIVPPDACKPVSDFYIIASSDLIGKYYWLSFFGTGQGKNYATFNLEKQQNNELVYAGGSIVISNKDGRLIPIVTQNGRSAVVKNMLVFQNGQGQLLNFAANSTNTEFVDGLLWVDPNFSSVIFMEPSIRDSVFTRMFFFNGVGLNNFKLVFDNSEVKIFKVSNLVA